jgi:hypothetical protein
LTARKQNRESLSMGLLREEHGIEEEEDVFVDASPPKKRGRKRGAPQLPPDRMQFIQYEYSEDSEKGWNSDTMIAARRHVGFDARRFTPKGAENTHAQQRIGRYSADAFNRLRNIYSHENNIDITPGELFLAMFPESLIVHIMNATNNNMKLHKEDNRWYKAMCADGSYEWKKCERLSKNMRGTREFTQHEIREWIACHLRFTAFGHGRVQDSFSENYGIRDCFVRDSISLSYERWSALTFFLHISAPSELERKEDFPQKMDKIRPLHEACCAAWTKFYDMGENLVIDEQTIAAKMKHPFPLSSWDNKERKGIDGPQIYTINALNGYTFRGHWKDDKLEDAADQDIHPLANAMLEKLIPPSWKSSDFIEQIVSLKFLSRVILHLVLSGDNKHKIKNDAQMRWRNVVMDNLFNSRTNAVMLLRVGWTMLGTFRYGFPPVCHPKAKSWKNHNFLKERILPDGTKIELFDGDAKLECSLKDKEDWRLHREKKANERIKVFLSMEGIVFLVDADERSAVNLMTTKYLSHDDVTFLPKGRSSRYGNKRRSNHAEEYNFKMNGTDVCDQLRTNLRRHVDHRRKRWIVPIIQWYIDQSRVNAWLLHKEIVEAHNKHKDTSPNDKIRTKSQRDFVQEVCEYLAVQRNVETGVQTRKRKSANEEEGESFNNLISPSAIDSGERKQQRKSFEMKLCNNHKLPKKEFINFKGHRPQIVATSTTNTAQPRCVLQLSDDCAKTERGITAVFLCQHESCANVVYCLECWILKHDENSFRGMKTNMLREEAQKLHF